MRPLRWKSRYQTGDAETNRQKRAFFDCLNSLVTGRTAMWYDATSAAGSLEAQDSPHRGNFGYVAAPVVKTSTLKPVKLISAPKTCLAFLPRARLITAKWLNWI